MALFASAPLNSNRIFNNTIGIVDFVNSSTTGLGFLAGATPNLIIGNGTGVQLNGLMQGQIISSNGVGVTGSGVLGGTSLDSANHDREQHDRRLFRRRSAIQSHRPQSAFASPSRAASSSITMPSSTTTSRTSKRSGTHGVQIINNTFFSTSQDNVLVDGGSNDIQVLNNVMWAKAGYDLNVADNSRSRILQRLQRPVHDRQRQARALPGRFHRHPRLAGCIQQIRSALDRHDVGESDRAQPRFVDASLGDFRVFSAAAGLRPTSPTIATGDPALDLALPSAYHNLLTNPSFESGVTGWSVNVGGGTQSSNPTAFDGSSYFYSGAVASGFAQQTISLTGTTNMDLIFGGRIRSAAENPADQGTLILTFLDGSSNPIGSPITLTATNVNDRWELVSSRVHIPAGAASVTYRFQNLRQTGSTDDSYLDHAFVYMVPNTLRDRHGRLRQHAGVGHRADRSEHSPPVAGSIRELDAEPAASDSRGPRLATQVPAR